MRIEKIVGVITISLIVILTLINIGLFIQTQLQSKLYVERINKVKLVMQAQDKKVSNFIAQLRACQTIEDVDIALADINVKRIVVEKKGKGR